MFDPSKPMDLLQRGHTKILAQSDPPPLNWASQTFDGKLRRNGYTYGERNGHNGERIGKHHCSFQWYDRWPHTTSHSLKMGVPNAPFVMLNFEWPYLRNGLSDPLHVSFSGRVFRVGGSNGAISEDGGIARFPCDGMAFLFIYNRYLTSLSMVTQRWNFGNAVSREIAPYTVFREHSLVCNMNPLHRQNLRDFPVYVEEKTRYRP